LTTGQVLFGAVVLVATAQTMQFHEVGTFEVVV